MVTKKGKEKKEEKKEAKKKEENKGSLYFYAVGRRKTAVSQVRLYSVEKNEKGIEINGRKMEAYLNSSSLSGLVKSPLIAVGQEGKLDVVAKACGGGISSQAEATRLGIARALVKFNGEYKKLLRDHGYLTRDARVVERKKPGLKKARKSPQWAKR